MWLRKDFIGVHSYDKFCRPHMVPPLCQNMLGLGDGGVVRDVSGEAV